MNAKKITAVKDATYAVAKRKREKLQVCQESRTLTSAIPVQCSNQLSSCSELTGSWSLTGSRYTL